MNLYTNLYYSQEWKAKVLNPLRCSLGRPAGQYPSGARNVIPLSCIAQLPPWSKVLLHHPTDDFHKHHCLS